MTRRPHFSLVAHHLTELIRTDYNTDYSNISYTQVLFWLLNRGSVCFSSSFYGSPSSELQKASLPLTLEEFNVQRETVIHIADTECIYYLFDLFVSVYRSLSLTPAVFEMLIELLSGYVNEDGTVNDEDFNHAFYTVVDESEDSEKEIVISIDSFCDLCFLLFHDDEDSDSVAFIYLVTLLCILQFLVTKDIDGSTSLLMTYLVDTNNQYVVPNSSLESFFHSIIWLMTGVKVDAPNEDGFKVHLLSSHKTHEDQQYVVNDLVECIAHFGSPSHIKDPTLREKIQVELGETEGVHQSVYLVVLQHIFLGFLQRWNYHQFIICLIQLMMTPHLDSFLTESNKLVDSKEECISVEEVKESDDNRIELFSRDSAIGVALCVSSLLLHHF